MSNQPMDPQFDDQFWINVSDRVERVRDLTRDELGRAQHELLAVPAEAEVVPVFTSPFWTRVQKRSTRVRRMALDELADAEERLVNQEPVAGRAAIRRRVAAMVRIPQVSMSPRARVNTLGFVTAVLAVLMLLPQIMPISSLAGVGTRGPLGIFFSADDNDNEGPPAADDEPEVNGASSSPATRGGAAGSTPASRPGSNAGATPASPNPASPAGAVGAGGSDEQGASGAPGGDASGAAGAASPGASVIIDKPAAPSNLLVTAIDDTTVRLRWTDRSSNEAGFTIDRKAGSRSRATTEADIKSFVWQQLPAGSEACFRVRAHNDGGSSDWHPAEYTCVTTHESRATPAPVSLTPLACSQEGVLASGAQAQETQITFRNTSGQTVNIYALGREGVREATPTALAPQASTTIKTFLGHPYVVAAESAPAGCLAIFTGRSWDSVAVIEDPVPPAQP